MRDEYAGIARLYAALLDPVLSRTRRSVLDTVRSLGATAVLDICCGTGALCRDLAAAGVDMTGVDLSGAMLAEACRRSDPARPVRYMEADARELPFGDGAYDVCVLSLCLHENAPEDRPLILAEASRVGRALVAVDYAADRGPLGALVHVPERIAGKRHYGAFRDFINRGALEGLLKTEGYAVLARERVLLGAGLCAHTVPGRRRGDAAAGG